MKRKKKHGQKRKKRNLYWRQSAPAASTGKKKIKPPSKKAVRIILICLLAASVILLGCIFLPKLFHKDSVDMREYLQISVSGKNGEGVLSCSENTQYLAEIMGYTPENASDFYTDEVLERLDAMGTYQVDFSKGTGLSNNDVVQIKISFMGNAASKAGFKPENTEFSYIVQGLEE